MVAAITGLVVPGNQRHFGAKVAARILSFYCLNFCRRSNQKKCYKHVALELRVYVALAVFQPHRDLEAGDNQSLKFKWRGGELNPGPLALQAKSLTNRPPPLPGCIMWSFAIWQGRFGKASKSYSLHSLSSVSKLLSWSLWPILRLLLDLLARKYALFGHSAYSCYWLNMHQQPKQGCNFMKFSRGHVGSFIKYFRSPQENLRAHNEIEFIFSPKMLKHGQDAKY